MLFCGALFVLQAGLLDVSIVYEFSFLLLCGSPITSHITFSMFSGSVSGVPSRARPSPGTTNNQYLEFFICVS